MASRVIAAEVSDWLKEYREAQEELAQEHDKLDEEWELYLAECRAKEEDEWFRFEDQEYASRGY